MVFTKIDLVKTTYSHSHLLLEIENVKDYPHMWPLSFDWVDRNMLLKLKSMGFRLKILRMIKSIYPGCMSTVNVNGYLTENLQPVCQGDGFSPTHIGLCK
jgi:hypothetical protein